MEAALTRRQPLAQVLFRSRVGAGRLVEHRSGAPAGAADPDVTARIEDGSVRSHYEQDMAAAAAGGVGQRPLGGAVPAVAGDGVRRQGSGRTAGANFRACRRGDIHAAAAGRDMRAAASAVAGWVERRGTGGAGFADRVSGAGGANPCPALVQPAQHRGWSPATRPGRATGNCF